MIFEISRSVSQCFHDIARANRRYPIFCLRKLSNKPNRALNSAERFLAPNEQATETLAQALAQNRSAGDCICLTGAVGSGKSVFSRAFVRAIAQEEDLPVPSPTYLLQNIYDFEEGPSVHHFDLYRLENEASLHRLDLPTSLTTAICLIEWADRLGGAMPDERLDINIEPLELEAAECSDSRNEKRVQAEAYDYTDERGRVISLQAFGESWRKTLAQLGS